MPESGSYDSNCKTSEENYHSKPHVGMGITEVLYSDREPYEIIEVIDDRHIVIRKYDAIRIDKNGAFTEDQEYSYVSNPNNEVKKLFLTKNGVWKERLDKRRLGCNKFYVGKAEKYFDYSF